MLEETYHFKQNLSGLNNGSVDREILNEIDAKKWLISVSNKYKIPHNEIELTEKQRIFYETELKKRRNERSGNNEK